MSVPWNDLENFPTNSALPTVPVESPTDYYHSAHQQRNTPIYRLVKETGISESLFGKKKKNPTSRISPINLSKIADYLGCSVDYLLGRNDTPEINH